MAFINFDCPECGHNLEVDEGGAGFIVKCPECGHPLQIPELPRSRRFRKIALASTTVLAILVLLGTNVFFWFQARALDAEVAELRPLGAGLQQAQALALDQEAQIADLKRNYAAIRLPDVHGLGEAALASIDRAETLSAELAESAARLLESDPDARLSLLRAHMSQVVQEAKSRLPAAPIVTEADPGRGIGGKKIVFPVLPGPDGQTLRENAEVTGVAEDKVSVKFAGGTGSYSLTELHPGVTAFLPVDPLLALPRRQWPAEVSRVSQLQNARRDQQLAELREAIESRLPAPPK